MPGADFLELGSWNAECAKCGFKFKASDMVKESAGDGLSAMYTCKKCWRPRQPQDYVRAVPDNQRVPWVQKMNPGYSFCFQEVDEDDTSVTVEDVTGCDSFVVNVPEGASVDLDVTTSVPTIVNNFGNIESVDHTGTGDLTINTFGGGHTCEDYYYDDVVILMHLDGGDATEVYKDEKGHTFTRNGTAGRIALSTGQQKWGPTSLKALGTASADFIDTPASGSDFNFSTGDWTVEFWVWIDSSIANGSGIIGSGSTGTTGDWYIGYSSGFVTFNQVGGSALALISTAVSTEAWHHIAVQRKGNRVQMWVDGLGYKGNGASQDTFGYVSTSNVFGHATAGVKIGAVGATVFKGFIDDIRITKGVARYATFTVPVDGHENDNDTILLMPFDTGGSGYLNDAHEGAPFVIATGAPVADTSIKKFGNSSIYFDSAGPDKIHAAAGGGYTLGIANWTIEGWIRMAVNPTGDPMIWAHWANNQTSWGFRAGDSSKKLTWSGSKNGSDLFGGTIIICPSTIPADTWLHFCIQRNADVVSTFLDGQPGERSTGWASSPMWPSTAKMTFGDFTTGTLPFKGWLDDCRLSRIARYNTGAFTIPTAAFPNC